MGLFELLTKYEKNDKDLKLLILGLDNAGKTTILKNLTNEEPKNLTPTQGFNIKSITNENFKLSLWDIGGQESIRQYWKHYYEKTSGIIFVIDSSDDERVKECNTELKILINDKLLQGVPLLVYANKQDLIGLDCDEISNSLELDTITNRKWSIFSCSAIKNEGVNEGISWLLSEINK